MDHGLIFSVLWALGSVGGIFIAIGVMKWKLSQTSEENAAQAKQIENLAAKNELAQAISRSDEMLNLMRKRADEDRAAGEGRYKELYGIINTHGERIAKLETSHTAVLKMLDEIKASLNLGLKDIREELKDLKRLG